MASAGAASRVRAPAVKGRKLHARAKVNGREGGEGAGEARVCPVALGLCGAWTAGRHVAGRWRAGRRLTW